MQYLQTNAEDGLILICCLEIFRTFIIHNFSKIQYSKTCVKWPLSKGPKIGFQDQLSLNEGQKYWYCLQYFRPSVSYHLSLRSVFCLFLSGRFTQVFTEVFCRECLHQVL